MASHEILSMTKEDDWTNVLSSREKSLGVVLRDRLMTDAALGGFRPIKSDHSYSLLTNSPPATPVQPGSPFHISNSDATLIHNNSRHHGVIHEGHKVITLRARMDDMEDECYPAISLDKASGRGISPASETLPVDLLGRTSETLNKRHKIANPVCLEIKDEVISAPNSPSESYVPSHFSDKKTTIAIVSPHQLPLSRCSTTQTSDSEDDDEEFYESMNFEFAPDRLVKSGNYRVECQILPPTPPSSASSDSEGTGSASCSSEHSEFQRSSGEHHRNFSEPRLCVNAGHSIRQPIHTSLISCQPKDSTGNLTLTDEEKRTLVAEGYPVPTKLPLTKQEEKSLKKVRRKIKNKISAQESRRKKKEYMDGLESRVTVLMSKNSSYRDRLTSLEKANRQLLKELERLRTLLESRSS
ncbi:cyclic AMP response element-binding protein A-like isoform X2 [Diachasmimorpha longicaudata]